MCDGGDRMKGNTDSMKYIPLKKDEYPEKKIAAVIFDMYETLVTQYATEVYFGKEMSADLGVPIDCFKPPWQESDESRSLGKLTLQEVLTRIMKQHRGLDETMELTREDQEKVTYVVEKRTACKRRQFEFLHEGIVPMLKKLHTRGIKVGLISNCFSEEAVAIRESSIVEYFDAVVLSYEVGRMKPDPNIYRLCTQKLGVLEYQCLFVGDGGSNELDGATAVGMKAVQAGWYLDPTLEGVRKRDYQFLRMPDEVLEYCR